MSVKACAVVSKVNARLLLSACWASKGQLRKDFWQSYGQSAVGTL